VQGEPGMKGRGEPPWGDLVLEALKGIRSEILLYGIVVIVIIAGSAQFGIAVLEKLEIPLLVFATIVLVIYFILALQGARRKVTGKDGHCVMKSSVAGGRGGSPFVGVAGRNARIHNITVRGGNYIDYLMMNKEPGGYVFEAGTPHEGQFIEMLTLEPGEYITGISGKSGFYIDRLTIHTNRRDFGPYGGSGGSDDFKLVAGQGKEVCGFHGRSGEYIDALGILYRDYVPPPR
jgi:hypothetical protein